MDARPGITEAVDAFGVPATVTPPGGDPVETRLIWLVSTIEHPGGADLRRAEVRHLAAIPLTGLSDGIPRGTAVSAPEHAGGDVESWKVDTFLRLDVDFYRVVLVAA